MAIISPTFSHLAVVSVTEFEGIGKAICGRGILNGLTLTKGNAGLTVCAAVGSAMAAGNSYVLAAAKQMTLCAANGSLPRKDAVFFWPDQSTVSFITGTAATRPRLPNIEQSQILLGEVYVSATATYLTPSYVRTRALAVSPTISNIGGIVNRTRVKLTSGIYSPGSIDKADLANASVTREKINTDRAAGSAAPGAVAGLTKLAFVNGSTLLRWVGYSLGWLNLQKAKSPTAISLAYTITASKAKIGAEIWYGGTFKSASNISASYYFAVG